jgi:hypothetical protein
VGGVRVVTCGDGKDCEYAKTCEPHPRVTRLNFLAL